MLKIFNDLGFNPAVVENLSESLREMTQKVQEKGKQRKRTEKSKEENKYKKIKIIVPKNELFKTKLQELESHRRSALSTREVEEASIKIYTFASYVSSQKKVTEEEKITWFKKPISKPQETKELWKALTLK
ncbi:hypothetical protein L1987_27403 [Smallanthus sonchifolius]|uniref:Uncharacterized protein n=1 Tax=Smallanthus sonchifolius TaxID=185202 RepID=A0ACB9IAK2_9ASTR|nr:hypothetical protein L1987_27403 [Smallanthus sonchifolius]